MAFDNVSDTVGKKLGPLPVWAWGLFIGGAFVIWYWVSNKDLGSGTTPVDGDLTTEAPPSGDFSTVPVIPGAAPIEDENTNGEWLIQAMNAVSKSGVSFLAAQTALTKYLNGDTLTAQQEQIVNKAIGLVGPPPEGTASAPDVTPEPGDVTVNWATKTNVGVRSPVKYGSTVIVGVGVDWVDPKGHTSKPQGKVTISLDNAMTKTFTLLNGRVVRPIVIGKNIPQFRDKAIIVTARFVPPAGAKGKSSTASPATIRIR